MIYWIEMKNLNYTELSTESLEFVEVCSVEDLPAGERLFVDIDNLPVVVFQVAGKYFAVADVCSHDDNPLGDGDLDGFEVSCPRHGARFDIRNGKACMLPAVENIPAYPVRVTAGKIEIGIPV